MRRLAVKSMGDAVQRIELRGDPRSPEPETVRVAFPGGDVDVVRCADGSYWVHVRVASLQDVAEEAAPAAGRLCDARLDVRGRHAADCDAGDFGHPDLYHLAVRVARLPGAGGAA